MKSLIKRYFSSQIAKKMTLDKRYCITGINPKYPEIIDQDILVKLLTENSNKDISTIDIPKPIFNPTIENHNIIYHTNIGFDQHLEVTGFTGIVGGIFVLLYNTFYMQIMPLALTFPFYYIIFNNISIRGMEKQFLIREILLIDKNNLSFTFTNGERILCPIKDFTLDMNFIENANKTSLSHLKKRGLIVCNVNNKRVFLTLNLICLKYEQGLAPNYVDVDMLVHLSDSRVTEYNI